MKSKTTMLEMFGRARNTGVPVVAISTPDPATVISQIRDRKEQHDDGYDQPIYKWDVVRGLEPVNETARQAMPSVAWKMPHMAVNGAPALVDGSILFIHLGHQWMDKQVCQASALPYVQALWTARDECKAKGTTIVLLGPEFKLPAELRHDVLVIDHELPTREEIETVVKTVFAAADDSLVSVGEKPVYIDMKPDVLAKVVEANVGTSAFAAEQNTSLCCHIKYPNGIDLEGLWERKIATIEQTPGLTVYRGGSSFDDIGGCFAAKEELTSVMCGRMPYNVVVWIDEIEKSNLTSTGDLSGVNSDALGQTLTYMEDHDAYGVIFLGPPGTAKSQFAKSLGSLGDVLVIRLDMGAMKGSLVGQSEQNLRSALQVITAIGNGRSLFVATANRIDSLDTALQRRFSSVIFFDMPDAEEREAIWPIWTHRCFESGKRMSEPQVKGDWNNIDCSKWAGDDIKRCCRSAWQKGQSIEEVAKLVIPVGERSKVEIEELRQGAAGKYLSANKPGPYAIPVENKPKRKMKAFV